MKKKRKRGMIISYIVLILVMIVMIYPLLWLVFGSFKDNSEIFSTANLLPKNPTIQGYIDGWKGSGEYTF